MAREWYCNIQNQEFGPLTSQKLVSLAKEGRLAPTDPVRLGTDGRWVPAGKVRGLRFDKARIIQSRTDPAGVKGPATSIPSLPAASSLVSRAPVRRTKLWYFGGVGLSVAGLLIYVLLYHGSENRPEESAYQEQDSSQTMPLTIDPAPAPTETPERREILDKWINGAILDKDGKVIGVSTDSNPNLDPNMYKEGWWRDKDGKPAKLDYFDQ